MRFGLLAWAGWLGLTLLGLLTPGAAGEGDVADPVPPTVEGRALVFPTHGLRWALPEDSPFEWENVTEREARRNGNLASAYASTDEWQGRVTLRVAPAGAPRNVRLPVQAEWLATFGASSTSTFDEAKTRVDYGATLGGVPARVIQKEGLHGSRPVLVEMHEAYLRSLTFVVFAQLEGRDAGVRLGPAVEALIATLRFDDPRPWVPGPFGVKDVAIHDRPRGEAHAVVREVVGYCFEAVKPAGLASVVRPYHTPRRRLTWEAWSEDRSAYVFIGVDFLPWCGSNALRDLAPKYVRNRLAELKRAWPDLEPKLKRKKSCFPIRYAGHKGLGYEARGTRGGVPYVERGYIVKVDLAFLLVRLQFGGTKAEKAFAKPVRAVEKSFKPGDNRG